MGTMMILRIVALLLLSIVCSTAMGSTSLEFSKIEDVALHDGRQIKVERKVYKTTQFHLFDPFFGLLPFYPRTETLGNKFSLKFKHPDTQETITWQGELGFEPLLLDIVNGVTYLVVNGRVTKDTESIYGCPELPYIYLRYESGFFGKWHPVPVEKAPDMLRKANLPHHADGNDGGYFQQVIPRSYDEWNYLYKNNHLNERQFGDCRPPRAPLPQVSLPVAIEGSPDILETIDYTPDRVVVGDDWTNLVFDLKREGECKKLFRPTDPHDYMQGQRFINDSTGGKPVPYSRAAQFDMGVRLLCDDNVWFVTHQEERGKIVISKFTVTGDLVFRTSFRNPARVEGFVGYIRIPSLHSEGGYLYFDWLDFRDINREWHIKRLLKMRMREPVSQNIGSSK